MMPPAMTEPATQPGARDSGDRQTFQHTLASLQARVERALEAMLQGDGNVATSLRDAMAYATLAGGKRVRAVLVYGAGRAAGAVDQRQVAR